MSVAATTRVSAPGKLILMGEHSAVYGRPALVAAVGLRMRIAMRPEAAPGLRIHLPALGYDDATTWKEIKALTRRAREAWEAYAAAPSPAGFASLGEADAGQLVKLAVGEASEALGEPLEPTGRCRGLDLRIDSDLPVGAGLGSSAAAAVGLVTAYLATATGGESWDRVEEIALEVERRQHGLPSGVDGATVFHGGVIWAERRQEELRVEPLAARRELLSALRVFHTGSPAESTGAVVAEVRARRDADPAAFEAIFDRMARATDEMRGLLLDDRAEVAEMARPIRECQRCLEEIGVVSDAVRETVREIEHYGGAAKISGAGTLGDRGAGCLLVTHPDPDALDRIGILEQIEEMPVSIGAEGTRLEAVG